MIRDCKLCLDFVLFFSNLIKVIKKASYKWNHIKPRKKKCILKTVFVCAARKVEEIPGKTGLSEHYILENLKAFLQTVCFSFLTYFSTNIIKYCKLYLSVTF